MKVLIFMFLLHKLKIHNKKKKIIFILFFDLIMDLNNNLIDYFMMIGYYETAECLKIES